MNCYDKLFTKNIIICDENKFILIKNNYFFKKNNCQFFFKETEISCYGYPIETSLSILAQKNYQKSCWSNYNGN